MAAWARTLTPDDVRQENAFRAAQRKDGKSRKANMKDPNAPKKPLSAYFMFLQRIRASPDMVKEVFGEEVGTTKQSVLAAAKWRSMSDEEKKVRCMFLFLVLQAMFSTGSNLLSSYFHLAFPCPRRAGEAHVRGEEASL